MAAPAEQHLAFDSSQQGMAVVHARAAQLLAGKRGHPSFSETLSRQNVDTPSVHSASVFGARTVPARARRGKYGRVSPSLPSHLDSFLPAGSE